MAAASSAGGAVVYVLGTEGCGKSHLLHQLGCLGQGTVAMVPSKIPATTGQNITKLHIETDKDGSVVVELRELGGSLLPTWESFLKSREEQGRGYGSAGVRALLFAVDASSPHQLAVARYAYQWLVASPAAWCHAWPTAVVLQKCAAPGAITRAEVAACLGIDIGHAGSGVVLEVDSWNGIGLGDVLHWLRLHTCGQRPD